MSPSSPNQSLSRRTLMFGSLALTALGLSACSKPYVWHQKITVTVATPTGDVSGSSVTEVSFTNFTATEQKFALDGSAGSHDYKGEAAAVQVAPGRWMFTLLEEKQVGLAVEVFVNAPYKYDDEHLAQMKAPLGPAEIPPKLYPMLVTFDDINDPKSVKEVKPDDLAASFGPGFALKGITVSVTDEPLTAGTIKQVIPWVFNLHGSIGKDMNLPIDHILNKIFDGSFSTRMPGN